MSYYYTSLNILTQDDLSLKTIRDTAYRSVLHPPSVWPVISLLKAIVPSNVLARGGIVGDGIYARDGKLYYGSN